MNNIEDLLSPYLNEVLNSSILELENSLGLKNNFSEKEKKEFENLLKELTEIIKGYEGVILPTIMDKITNIKNVISKVDVVCEGEEHPLNTQHLSDTQ